jgi:hypothetical protein
MTKPNDPAVAGTMGAGRDTRACRTADETEGMNVDTNSAGDSGSDTAEAFREIMDEKVKIAGGINPSREKDLGALLRDLPGVESVSVAGDEVSITYDPTKITSKEMHERMKGGGFTPEDTEIAPTDPPVGH